MKAFRLQVIPIALILIASTAAVQAGIDSDWYAILDTTQKASGQSAASQAHSSAVVGAAILAAGHGLVEQSNPAHAAENPPHGADLDAAVAQAACTTLQALFPDQAKVLDTQLAASLQPLTSSAQQIADGRAWGKHVAQTILAEFPNDAPPSHSATFAEQVTPTGAAPVNRAPADVSIDFAVFAGLGGIAGSADGQGNAARFGVPNRIATDLAGNVYVADVGNYTIRKITPAGSVTTLAGLAGSAGSADGQGNAARFGLINGLAVDRAGNVFVADSSNQTIRKITPAGLVSTLAGLAGTPGSGDGVGSAARFDTPGGLAVDSNGNVFVSSIDSVDVVVTSLGTNYRHWIRKITPAGAVSTLPLPFENITDLAIDGLDTLYVLEAPFDFVESADMIYQITPAGVKSDLTSPLGLWWYVPSGLTVDQNGNVFVTDSGPPSHVLSVSTGRVDILNSTTNFGVLADVAADNAGRLFLVDSVNHTILAGAIPDLGDPVRIISQPALHITAMSGQDVTLAVTATGSGTLSYQWFGQNTGRVVSTGPVLTLRNVTGSDQGVYFVVVSNGTTSATSDGTGLQVDSPINPPQAPPSAPASSSGGGAFGSWFLGALAFLWASRAFSKFKGYSFFGRSEPD